MTRRQLGGALVVVGVVLIVAGVYAILADLWPDSEISAASLIADLLFFLLPGLLALVVGAMVGRR